MASRQDADFLAGRIGVDGQATEEAKDPEEVERDKAIDALGRNRAYLGREFLTWLLFRSDRGDPITTLDDEPVTILLVGKVTLRGVAGEATELAAKGQMSAYSAVVKNAIAEGLLIHTGRLRLMHGEHVFEVTLDAENLDHKSADIPALLSEEEDDRLSERLWLVEKLTRLVDALWDTFLELRASRRWSRTEVPAIEAFLRSA